MEAANTGRSDLRNNIARRAMLERGLLPEFSAAALRQADSISVPAATTDLDTRDLRASSSPARVLRMRISHPHRD